VRLLQGQVLIAGYIAADVVNSVAYFSAEDTIHLFEAESSMITKTVGETKTIYLDDNGGSVTFERLQYGTDILLKKSDPDFLPSSVFIQRAHSFQFALPVYETTYVKGDGDEVKVYRICHSKDSSPSSWTVTLDPKVVIAAPYLAGLNRKAKGASRPRSTSFTTGYKKKPSATNMLPMAIPGMKKKKSTPAAA